MPKKILVVAAHPDDEVLGCGGTMARYVAEGDEVHVVFMADGVSARNSVEHASISKRNVAAEKACNILGVTSTSYLNLPDNKMDSLPLLEVVQKLEEVINKIRPSILYTHHAGDLNVDHRITHQACLTACRPLPMACVRQIFSYEVLSSTAWQTPDHLPFLPNKFVDVSAYMGIKILALQEYADEMRPEPHARSIEGVRNLASYRGFSVGIASAEAFTVIRDVS